MNHSEFVGRIPTYIGAEMGDDHVRDFIVFQFQDGCNIRVESLSERSRFDRIDGDLADLVDVGITSAMSSTHYEDGQTFFALNIASGEGSVTLHWIGDGYIPYDVEVRQC